MTRTAETLPALLFALSIVVAAPGPAVGEGDEATPVVVELFTSQGCSSCPPADRLLSRLGDEGLPGAVRVIPLSFHVDYWNYIGWTDPFSSSEWSDRQRRYARAMALDTIYTPQVVVQGATETVGSNTESVLRAIAREQSRGVGVAIDLRLEPTAGDRLTADITAHTLDTLPGDGTDLMVALFETRLVTSVARGENASRTLENDYVVRTLRRAFRLDGRSGSRESGSVDLSLDPAWKRSHLGVAVFAQDPASLHIHGAAAARLH